ncbi:UNVERIFIED_ORG: Ca2+-dependent lipid-binding protein [Bacillus sp. 1751]|nr:Ca2+-dependent lipid-binding protein [Bacillus sp. 1751]
MNMLKDVGIIIFGGILSFILGLLVIRLIETVLFSFL